MDYTYLKYILEFVSNFKFISEALFSLRDILKKKERTINNARSKVPLYPCHVNTRHTTIQLVVNTTPTTYSLYAYA